jgi:hypothetical protein
MTFLTLHKVKFQALREPSIGPGWKLTAISIFAEAKAMIRACQSIMFVRTDAKGATSVRATITRNNSITLTSKYY